MEHLVQFICLSGEGHGCAEDVGGYSGWDRLLKTYDAESPTKDQREKMEWFEQDASNNDPSGLRGEKKWMWDKDDINIVLREFAGLPKSHVMKDTPALEVLLISLELASFLEDTYPEVLTALRSKARVTVVTHIAGALQHLSKGSKIYSAVVIADALEMQPDMTAVQEELVEYAKKGGTVVFGMLVSSFATFPDIDRFLRTPGS